MKQIFIIFFILTAFASCSVYFLFYFIQTSFLRQLLAVSAVDYGSTCVTSLDKTFKIKLTLDSKLSATEKIEASLAPSIDNPQAENTFEYSYTESGDAPAETIELTTNSNSTPLAGPYKLTGGKYTDTQPQTTELKLPTNSLKYTPEFKLDTTQTASQEIDVSQTDKKTFVVKFNPAFTEVPKIFTTKDSDKEITCTADKDNKILTCTPSTTNMEEGKEYKVAFQQACDGAKVETGVTVKATKLTNSTTDASYMKISQLILFIGLFLL